MRVIALIDDPAVVRRILDHLGCWCRRTRDRISARHLRLERASTD